MPDSPPRNPLPRIPLHERSDFQGNTRAAIRLVPQTPPRLLGDHSQRDDIHTRTPLPTHPSHFLSPAGKGNGKGKDIWNYSDAIGFGTANENRNGQGKGWETTSPTPVLDDEFHPRSAKLQASAATTPRAGSSTVTIHTTHQAAQNVDAATPSPSPKPKPPAKKRLHIHKDNKTFSLLQDNDAHSIDEAPLSPTSQPSKKSSYDSLTTTSRNTGTWSTSLNDSYTQVDTSPGSPATPFSNAESKRTASADQIDASPWNYQLVGGLRKVPKTPDSKQRARVSSEVSPPPLPEISDGPTAASHDLSTKPSFQSATESTTTTSENTNYKVYGDVSPSASEPGFPPPSSSDSNYQIHGHSSTASSVIHRPQTAFSDSENYEVHAELSTTDSNVSLSPPGKYSQESLVVPPLKPRARRSNEHLGYYKSRSRESLRTGSLTSISTVLSQKEALRAIVGAGSLIDLPILNPQLKGSSSWAQSLVGQPQRSYMNEHPHQWSSQLSTVLSVSDGGTDRGSRSWSDGTGRRSSGFPSTPSRHSRQLLSISSSLAQEEDRSRSRGDWIEPPRPTVTRYGERHLSSSSVRMIEDQDEYGDGITDLQDLRTRPSRNRISGLYSSASSDNGRTNTMQSTASSRTNSLLGNSLPTWARLYYGSGERRYLGAPGSSTEGTDSRASSLRTGSPNTDHFPLSIYSPRRRPRESVLQPGETPVRSSMEIAPVVHTYDDGQVMDHNTRRLRTWSMSSVWSPHLRLDRRATWHGAWAPPSVNWSTEGGWYGRRNIQIVLFVSGFIIPFGWMIAAFLPLPPKRTLEMAERDDSTSNLGSSDRVVDDFARHLGPMDESRYESARWWRKLNRWMSLVGLLIIIIIIVLVIVSIEQGW